MNTRVKNDQEIAAMRTSGRLLATVLATLQEALQPGMTTQDLADIARRELRGTGGTPTFLGYYGFPDVLCVSVNEQVVHGIPSAKKVIKNGDVVSMDFGVTYDGMITDSAITRIVGSADQAVIDLVETTRKALYAGFKALHDQVNVGDIAVAVQSVLEQKQLGIVRELVGHGVGHELHEDPNIPNYGKAGTGPKLAAGMTIAIEPMATLGDHQINIDEDGWTVYSRDGSLAAHFEHTVLITQNGAEILTAFPGISK